MGGLFIPKPMGIPPVDQNQQIRTLLTILQMKQQEQEDKLRGELLTEQINSERQQQEHFKTINEQAATKAKSQADYEAKMTEIAQQNASTPENLIPALYQGSLQMGRLKEAGEIFKDHVVPLMHEGMGRTPEYFVSWLSKVTGHSPEVSPDRKLLTMTVDNPSNPNGPKAVLRSIDGVNWTQITFKDEEKPAKQTEYEIWKSQQPAGADTSLEAYKRRLHGIENPPGEKTEKDRSALQNQIENRRQVRLDAVDNEELRFNTDPNSLSLPLPDKERILLRFKGKREQIEKDYVNQLKKAKFPTEPVEGPVPAQGGFPVPSQALPTQLPPTPNYGSPSMQEEPGTSIGSIVSKLAPPTTTPPRGTTTKGSKTNEPLRARSKSGRPIKSTDGGKTWQYE